jgi:uncharacterized membrane protein YqjE
METSSEKSPRIVPSLKKLLHIIVATAVNRLELAAVETREEAGRWVDTLILVAALAVVGGLSLVMLTVTIVVACWDEHRLAALISITLAYLLGLLGIVLRLRWRLKNWQSFAATIAEFQKDKACLENQSTTNYSSGSRL